MDSAPHPDFSRRNRSLIIGYGNIDRQDDGVAWHILSHLLARLNHPQVDPFEQPLIDPSPDLSVLYALQLTPEMAEMIAGYDRVCFVDAHTGAIAGPVRVEALNPEFISSPFTHHLTPATCLYLTETLYHRRVAGLLVSVQGYEFGFDRSLSSRTAGLAAQAVEVIIDWINQIRKADC
jgi:hydrogenase maturation protease